MAICFSPYVLHTFFGDWDMIFSLGDAGDMRVPVYFVAFSASNVLVAAAFPADDDLTSELGVGFVSLPVFIAGTLRSVGPALDFHRSSTQINAACTQVHAAVCALLVVNWVYFTRKIATGKLSWMVVRAVYAVEGMLFLLCTLAHRALGPPPLYAPGNVSFSYAILRALTPLGLSALFTGANRRRIAGVGVVHTVLELGDLSDGEGDTSGNEPAADEGEGEPGTRM